MKKKILIIFFLFFSSEKLASEINNSVIISVGNNPITRLDLIKEIKLLSVLSRTAINENNREELKSIAIQTLIKRTIKKSEIERLKINKYNPKDLEKQISKIANNLGLDNQGLKIFLGQNNSNFISASEGNIEISSSNFHLQANGDLTASSVLFDGGTIEGSLKINNDVEIGGFNGFTTIFFDDFSQYANVPALTGSGNNPKTDGTGQGYFYFSGNGEVSLESGEGAIFGNKVIKLGNDSGNDQVWFSSNQLIPFNSQSLYEMEIRIKKEESQNKTKTSL